MSRTQRSGSPLQWVLPLLALTVGILGMTAAWLALSLALGSASGWLAIVAALDMGLMLKLAAAPPGRVRSVLAVFGTALAIVASYWMIAAARMGALLGLTPIESAQRLGPVLAGEITRHATNEWDIAFAGAALVLAWFLGR